MKLGTMIILTLLLIAGCAGPLPRPDVQGPTLYLAPHYQAVDPYQPPCILERPMTGCREAI